jgi:hypothetical protein
MVDIMRIFRKKFFTDIFNKLIGKEKKLKIGFYAPPYTLGKPPWPTG